MYNITSIPEEIVYAYFISFIFLTVLSVLIGSHEYKKKGHLSTLGSLILLTCGIAQGGLALSVTFCSAYISQDILLLKITGVLLNVGGVIIMLIALINFKSYKRALGRDTGKLITSGAYSITRNPQYVGYGLMQIGWVVGWWTYLAVIALITYAVMAYLAVVMEETNLERIFGKEYKEYCSIVPRFLGL